MKRSFSLLYLIATAAASLLLASCDPDQVKNNFPHKPHIEEEIACDACHAFGEETVGMPAFETCTTCHDAQDKEVLGRCFECHEKQNIVMKDSSIVSHKKIFQPQLPENWRDVQYKHAKFLKEGADCNACHTQIAKSERSSLDNLPSMKLAMSVQEQMNQSNDCQSCHLEISPLSAPLSHDSRWENNHGRMAKFFDKGRCLMCHEEAVCQTCHETKKPKDHTNLFRRAAHGVQAVFDRGRCLVCHREDQCESCHRSAAGIVPPQPFHVEGASCLSCHSRLAAQGPSPRPPQQFMKPMPHRMMMGATSQKCLECHSL
ncbi:MAG: cytochrome c3 family protein [Candidatus Omnitrophota bacterium]